MQDSNKSHQRCCPSARFNFWLFEHWLGCLSEWRSWCNFLWGQKARLTIVFVKNRFRIWLLRALRRRLKERSRLRKIKIDISWQIIDARTDQLMKFRHINIVHVLDELVSRPLFFVIDEIEFTNRMTIEGSLVPFNHWVMAINSHSDVIVRDGKGEHLSIQLFLALHRSKKFYKSSDGEGHAMRVLAIGNIESGSATLHLAGEEGKLHPRFSHEIGNNLEVRLTHERFQLIPLFLSECRSLESHGKIGLWTSFVQRER